MHLKIVFRFDALYMLPEANKFKSKTKGSFSIKKKSIQNNNNRFSNECTAIFLSKNMYITYFILQQNKHIDTNLDDN